MKKLVTLLLTILPLIGWAQEKTKVACIGNSVTYGMTHKNPSETSYPTRLQQLLGDRYEVRNFGHSGATLLSKGHRPYINLPEYTAALEFAPDIAIIHLGLNDTDPRNWPNYRDEFYTDYINIIDALRNVNPKVEVYVCQMTPIFHWHRRFKSGTRDWYWQIQEQIPLIAEYTCLAMIPAPWALGCRASGIRSGRLYR
jgi:sialate O-acetylesterase